MRLCHFKDDTELIRSCINRDDDAWSYFVNRYSPLVISAIGNRFRKYQFTATAHELKEVRQSLFSSIWEDNRLSTISDSRSIGYWLSITAGNAAIDYVRKRRRLEKVEVLLSSQQLDRFEIHEETSGSGPSQVKELTRKEISEQIDEAIRRLPAKERLVIKLNILHGKKYDEIAGMLDMPQGSVATHVRRAKEKLKEILKNLK